MHESASQNGLAIAKDYWLQWGHPWLAARHPQLLERIGVGLFSGSEVLGADDALSRDHGWGPRLEIFRSGQEGFSNEALQSEMTAAAPAEWEGFQNRYQFAPSIQVHNLAEYFGRNFPRRRLPESPLDWVCCDAKLPNLESHLHFVRHGAVFHDPAGILAEVRARLRTYPEDVWLLRMAQLCFDLAHYGEYNFCWRLVKRQDPVAAAMAVGSFQLAAMALSLVMDHDYAPYWKWLHHVFRSREFAARLDAHLLSMSTTLDYQSRAASIEAVCQLLMAELVERGILPPDLDDGSGLPLFFQARAYLLGRIGDPAVRALAG
ncbi:DUF4037 domain-containing protein [Desulfoferula mesophila]|uniref:DUF4037 domain-containing protein n=1 Tax=Desulfoferula mesophila TaxID=3058419 RepID=A0AAU9ENW8_9BACT|nr:hypothetical protein FAK_32850 [Desulfoferula mesophilus]